MGGLCLALGFVGLFGLLLRSRASGWERLGRNVSAVLPVEDLGGQQWRFDAGGLAVGAMYLGFVPVERLS